MFPIPAVQFVNEMELNENWEKVVSTLREIAPPCESVSEEVQLVNVTSDIVSVVPVVNERDKTPPECVESALEEEEEEED